ncbi:MAG: BolA family transcriptional regulator [Candidatus Dadabacteria bacterium]
MDPKRIKSIIESAILDSIVDVEGDGTHFQVVVVSSEFVGKGLLEQHQIVYKALGGFMNNIHALSLRTYTPEQWRRMK